MAVARLLAYGNIGLKAMKDESTGNDYNWLTRYPEIAYSRNMKRGLTFAVRGVPVTFEGLEDRLDSPEVIVTFKFNGRYVRVPTISEEKQMSLRSNLLGAETVMADPDNVNHIAAFMPGVCEAVKVKVGDVVHAGDVLYSINSMKMVTAFKATEKHEGKKVAKICVKAGDELQFRGTGEAPLVIELSK